MLLGFGEVMLRMAPPGFLRFRQALPGPVEATFGGGEANVCASLALLGRKTRYLTALPKHAVAESLVGFLRARRQVRARLAAEGTRLPPVREVLRRRREARRSSSVTGGR